MLADLGADVIKFEVDTFTVQKRPQMAGVIALFGHFELDNVGPQISQHRGAMRPGQHAPHLRDEIGQIGRAHV